MTSGWMRPSSARTASSAGRLPSTSQSAATSTARRLVPRELSQLVDVDVAAAQDAHDGLALLDGDEPREESADGRCCCSLHHELAARHEPEQRVEDLTIGQGDDVVDALAHDPVRECADALHAKAVDDAIDLVERHDLSLLDAALHSRRARGLDSDDARRRRQPLHGRRDSRDEPAASDRQDDGVDAVRIFNDLEPERALPAISCASSNGWTNVKP